MISSVARGHEAIPTLVLSFLATVVAGQFAVGAARAHEEYVADDEQDVTVAEFFDGALSDPSVVVALVAGVFGVLVVVAAYLAFRPFRRDIEAFRSAMAEYRAYLPWLLRISFGIPLIGAGFAGYFVSPAVGVELRILQVGLGFLLLFGLATRVTAVATLAVYLGGLLFYPTLLLQLEFVGGMVAIALLGSGKPSADHVLQRVAESPGTVYGRFDVVSRWARWLQARLEPAERTVPVVVRIGLGATFVYLGVGQKLLRPGLALAVVDRYDLTGVIPVAPELWVLGAGLTEAALGVALLVGAFTRASSVTAIFMFVLTLFALPNDPVLAHVGLFGMASVLLITGAGPYSVDDRLLASLADSPRSAPS